MEKPSTNQVQLLNEEEQFERFFKLSPDCMFKICLSDFSFVAVSLKSCDILGYTNEELCSMGVEDIEESALVRQSVKEQLKVLPLGQVIEVEGICRRKNGTTFANQVRICKVSEMYALASIRNIEAKKKLELLNQEYKQTLSVIELQNRILAFNQTILKMVVEHYDVVDILKELCYFVEKGAVGNDVFISILTLDPKENVLRVKAAPSIPEGFTIQAIVPIGPEKGTCGRAAFLKDAVVTEDIAKDPFWKKYSSIALQYGLKSCWSIPIVSSENIVLGTFAVYMKVVGRPSQETISLVRQTTNLAKIAIEQWNYQQSLQDVNTSYAVQNKELEKAKEQLELDKTILEDSEERLKEAQRLSKLGHWEYEIATGSLYWSEELYRMYKLSEEMTPAELYDAYVNSIHPDDISQFNEVVKTKGCLREKFKYNYRIIDGNGIVKYILGIARTIFDGDKIVGLRGTEQDVTELAIAKEAAESNEKKLEELLSNINEIVFAVDLVDAKRFDNPITYVNGDTLGIFGYTHKELQKISVLWTDRIHPEDLINVIDVSKQLHDTKNQVVREYRFKHKNGHYVWIEDNVSLGWSVDGKIQKLYGSVRDITERKEAEAALLESRERLELATQAAKLGSYDWKIDEDIVHWDAQMHALFGLPLDSDIDKGRYFADILHPEDHKITLGRIKEELSPTCYKTRSQGEYRLIIDGVIRHVETHVLFFRDRATNAVRRVIGTCLDITERKKAEALLISNEEKDILLKEIHHRVKNNLQVITSLLSLQSSLFDEEKQRNLFVDSQYRINSMAIVHEMLYQSEDLSKLDYRGYLEELSQFLIRSMKGAKNNIDLRIDVPELILGIDTAIPLGLLINEILTNSLKYGIKGTDSGVITIRITTSNAKLFILEIGDDGPGFVETTYNSKSLGMSLIRNLTRQLEGTIKRDYEKKGTNYIITFREL